MRRARMLAVGVAVLAVPATAQAATTTITAETVWRFGVGAYAITQGDSLVFKNNDALSPGPHNVTSEASFNGQPLFQSATGAHNFQGPVARAENLVPGVYPFICTVHPFMKSTLVVRPRAVPPPDTTPPNLTAQIHSARRALVLRSGRLRVGLSSDEAVDFAISTSTRYKKRTVGLAQRFTFKHPGGMLAIQVPLTGAGKTFLRTHKRVTVKVTLRARDAAGNRAVVSASRTLR